MKFKARLEAELPGEYSTRNTRDWEAVSRLVVSDTIAAKLRRVLTGLEYDFYASVDPSTNMQIFIINTNRQDAEEILKLANQ